MNYLQKKMAWIFGIFFLWIIVSVYWYVCGIRGFCSQNTQLDDKMQNEEVQIEEDLRIEKIKNKISLHRNQENQAGQENIREINEIKDIVVGDSDENDTNKNVQITKRTIKCYTYLNSYIKINSNKNIISEVKKLENFFNTYYEKSLAEDGIYDQDDVEAIEEFQEKNNLEIDGQVGPATQKVINAIYCVKTEKKD